MSDHALDAAANEPEGPARVAAVASWIQSLFPSPEAAPVLIGGGAVELYTGGAHRTGDLDFVGTVSAAVAARLEAAGFRREGRHWIHEKHRLFVEFPAGALDAGNERAVVQVGDRAVIVIGLEELIVDRLAAWRFWRSEIDARNAWLLWRTSGDRLHRARARLLAERAEVSDALEALEAFVSGHGNREPSVAELDDFARRQCR